MELTVNERRLINICQRGFPLTSRPFAEIAGRLDLSEDDVIAMISDLDARGLVSRLGAVVRPNTEGASTLAAMAVPEERLEQVARIVSDEPYVNHNYAREHRFNLWFVIAAPDRAAIDAVLARLEARTGLAIIDLPLERPYHIDLGFPV